MHGKLVYVSKNGEEKEELPVINLHFFIGSDLFCDLRIKHKDIAAQHCLITSQKDKPALIRNLSRTVPTLVNNTEIGTADVELKDQDIIAIRHKHFKWRYNDSSETSTSYASFGATSKNRKSWPFFKNKLVAVVTPQRRDEDVQVTESIQLGISQKEAPPKRRRGTIGGHISSSKKPSSPKVLAVKSGLKATHKQSFRKRKSDVKNAQPTRYVESTSQSFPSSSSKKKVKFLDTSLPRSRLGKRGQKRSITTPYKGTPTRRKVSVYSTPPSTLRYGRLRPVKSILKTPGSSSSTSSLQEHDQKLSYLAVPNLGSSPDVTLLSEVSEGSSPVLLENDVLRTPPKVDQPDVVMRSSRRKAAIIRSPKSTPKSATKKRKSLEEKSLEASERAAKQLKRGPPHAIDKKKRAALLQCHRKSLTPHPEARKCGKLITRFPPTFRSELKTASPQLSNMRKSEPLIFSTAVPKVFRFSSLEEPVSTEAIPAKSSATSREDIKQKKKSLSKSASKVLSTSPIVQKFTRASRAANALREWQQRTEVDDVLSALDLSRRWPPSQGLVNTNTSSQVDVSNLTGIKKLFCIDKTLDAKDVRELFLETSTDKSAQNLPEEHSENMSRHSALSAMSSSGCKEGSSLFNSFHSEGAPELPCSKSLLSGSSLSVPSYSSTSRRSLSLKKGRTSTSSPVRTASPIKDITLKSTGQSIEKKSRRNRDIQGTPSNTRSCKSRPKSNVQSIHLVEKDDVEELLNSDVSYISSISDQTCKSREGDNNQFLTCSSVQEKCPKNNFSGFNSSFSGKSSSYLDISSPFSDDRCGSYCKNRSSNSLSLMQVSGVHKIDEDTSLKHSVKIESSIHASQYEKFSPIYRKSHHKGRVSLRQVILKASTPKPEKISLVNETFLSLAEKVRPIKKKKLTVDEMSLSAVKKHSCSLPSSGDPATPTQDVSKIDVIKSTGKRRGRPSKLSYVANESSPDNPDLVVTRTSHSKSPIKNKNSIPNQTKVMFVDSEKHKRLPTTSVGGEATEVEMSTSAVKKHSHSLQSSAGDATTPKQGITKIDLSTGRRRGRPSKLGTLANESSSDISSVVHSRNSSSNPIKDKNSTHDQSEAMSVDSFMSEKRLLTSVGSGAKEGDTATPKQDILKTDVMSSGKRGRLSKLSNVFNESSPDVSAVDVARELCSNSSITSNQQGAMSIYSIRSEKKSRLSAISVGSRATENEMSRSAVKKRSRSLSSLVDDTKTQQDISKINVSTGRRRGRPSKLSTMVNESSPDIPSIALTRTSHSKSSIKNKTSTQNQTDAMSVDSIMSEIGDTTTPKQDISKIDESMKRRRGRPSKLSTVLNEPLPDVPVVAVTKNSRSKSSIDNIRSEKIRQSTTSEGSRTTKGEISTSAVKKRSRSLPSSVGDTAAPKQDVSKIDESMKRRRGRPSKLTTVLNESSPNVPVVAVTRNSRSKSSISIKPDHPGAVSIESFRSEKSSRLSTNSLGGSATKGEMSTSAVKKRSHSLPSSVVDTATPKQDISKIDESIKRRRGRPSKLSTVINEPSPDVPVVAVTRNSRNKSSITPDHPEAMFIESFRSEKSSRLSTNSVGGRATKGEISTSAVKKRSHSLPSSVDDTAAPKQDISKIDESMKRRRGRPSKLSTVINEPSPDVPVVAVTRNSRNKSSITPDHPEAMFIESFRSEKSSRLSTNSVGSRGTKGEISTSAVKKRSCSLLSSVGDTASPKQDISKIDESMKRRRGRPSKLSTVLNEFSPNVSVVSVTRNSRSKSSIDNIRSEIRNRLSTNSVGNRATTGEMSTSAVKKRSLSLPSSIGDTVTIKQDISKIDESMKRRRGRPSKLSTVLNEPSPDVPVVAVTRNSRNKSSITPDHPKAMFIESFRSEKSSRLSTNSVGGRATKGEISTSAEKKRFHSFGSSIGDTTTPKQDISKIYDIKSMGKRRGKTSKFSTVINDSSPDIPSMTLARTSHIKSSANDKNTTPNLAKAMSVGSGTTKGEMSTSGVKKRSRSLPSSVGDPATPKEDILKIDVIKSTGKRRGRPSKLSYVANESSPVHPTLAVTRTSHSKSPIKNKNKTSDLADALPVNKHLDFLQGDISSHVKESTSESVNWFSFSNSLVDSSCKTAEYATSSVGRHSLPYRDVTVNNLVPLSSSVPQIIRKGIRSRKIKFNPEFISPSQKVKNSKNHDIYKSKPLVSLGTSINRNKGNSSCSFSKSQQASSSTSFEIYDCNSHAISSNSSVVHSALETGTLGQVESGQVSTCRVTRSTSLSSGKLTPSDMVVSTSPKGREHSDGGSRPSQPLLPTVNPNSSEKSRKRKLTVEASLIPDSQSCGSCILDNSMSPIKKRLQTEETIFIQEASNKINKNKRSTWLGPSLKSKKLHEYETFSSTPLLPENSSVFSSSIIRKLRKSKHSTFQSPVGISPIVNNDKYTSSISDNSAVSMVALPATELPGKVGKSDKRSFFASNMLHKTILTDDASEIKSLALTPVSSNKIHSQSTRSPTRRLTRLQRSLVESRNPVDMNYSNKFSEVSVKDGLIKSSKSSLIEKNRTGCNGSSLEEPKISIASYNNVNGSTNKSLLLGTQSLRHSGIDFNDIVNKSTNKLKAESSTKTALISPSVQPGLPLTTIGLPITKENKSIHKELQSHDVLAICEKDEKPKLDKTERLSTNLIPVVKLSSAKRRTRTSKIPKEIESPTKKKPKPINVAKSFLVEEIIASPSATSNKLLRKRKVIKEESVSESGVEPHADKKKRTRDKEKPTDIPSIDSPPKTRKGRSANLASALAENDKVHSGGISTTRGSRLKQTANMSPQDIPARKKAVAKVLKSKDAYTPGDSFSKDGMNVNTLQMEVLPKGVGKGRNGRLIINRVLKGNEMEEKSIVLSAKSTLPQRRKRVAKVEKEIYEVAKNSPFTQKQGKSSKNDKLNIRPEKPKDIPSLQNIALRNKKGEKTANIELFINDESSNKKEVETLLVIQDEPRASLRGRHGKIINRPAQKIGSEKNSPGASSKTRSHVAVVVLKTQKKGTRAVISSPIVRSSPQLRRGRSNKINLKTQKLLNESTLSKPGRLGKETTANSTIDKQKATANSTKDEQNASQNNVSTKKRGRNYERPKIVKDNTKITTGELVNEGRPNRFVNESRPSRFEQKSVTRSSALALRSGKSVMRGFHEQALSLDVPKKGRSGEKDLDGNCRVDETKPLSAPPIKRRGRSATRKENVNSSSLGGSIIDSKVKPVPHAQEGEIRAAVEAQSVAVIPKKRGRPAGKTKQSVEVPKAVTAQRRGRSANQRQVDESTVAFSKPPARKVTSQHPIHCPEETSVSESNEGKMSKRKQKKAQSIASSENIFPAVVRKTRALQNRSSSNRKLDIAAKQKPSKNQLPSDKKSAVRETLKVSQQSKVKVTNIKVGDKKPLKSAIKKVIRVSSAGAKVKRLSSRKSRFDVIKKAVHFKPQGVKKSKIKRK